MSLREPESNSIDGRIQDMESRLFQSAVSAGRAAIEFAGAIEQENERKARVVNLASELFTVASAAMDNGARQKLPEIYSGQLKTYREGPGITYTAAGPLPSELGKLSPRQLDILGLITLGLSNSDVEERLSISKANVKFHLSKIYKQLGVKNRVQAAALSHGIGFLEWAASAQGDSKRTGELMLGTKKALKKLKSDDN